MRRWGIALVVLGTVLPSSTAASAATLTRLAPGSDWNSTPIHAASPPGDLRLFVVERAGGVRVVEDGVLRPAPFLTVPNVDTLNERGLLSIAFASGSKSNSGAGKLRNDEQTARFFLIAQAHDSTPQTAAEGDHSESYPCRSSRWCRRTLLG